MASPSLGWRRRKWEFWHGCEWWACYLPVLAQPHVHTKDEALNLPHKDMCGQASCEQLRAYKQIIAADPNRWF